MKVAFSGARHVTPAQESVIREQLRALDPDVDQVITGACIGVDALVARMAIGMGLPVKTIVPANRSQVDPDWQAFCHFCEILPMSDEPYRARNARMVELADKLVAFPARPQERSMRSGTWMTIGIARKKGIPVDIHILEEVTR